MLFGVFGSRSGSLHCLIHQPESAQMFHEAEPLSGKSQLAFKRVAMRVSAGGAALHLQLPEHAGSIWGLLQRSWKQVQSICWEAGGKWSRVMCEGCSVSSGGGCGGVWRTMRREISPACDRRAGCYSFSSECTSVSAQWQEGKQADDAGRIWAKEFRKKGWLNDEEAGLSAGASSSSGFQWDSLMDELQFQRRSSKLAREGKEKRWNLFFFLVVVVFDLLLFSLQQLYFSRSNDNN